MKENDENLCNDGRCKRVRMGEERHPKHLKEKIKTKKDKNKPFRNAKIVYVLFFGLVISGGMITYLTNTTIDLAKPLNEYPALKAAYTTVGLILVGLAFAVLNKGTNMEMYDRVERIEKKLDKILEHRDNVLQNK